MQRQNIFIGVKMKSVSKNIQFYRSLSKVLIVFFSLHFNLIESTKALKRKNEKFEKLSNFPIDFHFSAAT
jgi:hypothetical protein